MAAIEYLCLWFSKYAMIFFKLRLHYVLLASELLCLIYCTGADFTSYLILLWEHSCGSSAWENCAHTGSGNVINNKEDANKDELRD